jgi:DNA-binding transcriptional ArsR family regulator
MGTIENDQISSALFGKVRRAILALFFSRVEESFYLRQVIRLTGKGQGAVQRELKSLTDAGIITKSKQGRQVYYQVNKDCPVFKELRSLITKTAGLADVLRKTLSKMSNNIEIAFVYGSQANATAKPSSDVDLLVVGDIEELVLHRAVAAAERLLDRQVNYTLLGTQEFRRRRREKGGFLSRVLSGESIYIIGKPQDVR